MPLSYQQRLKSTAIPPRRLAQKKAPTEAGAVGLLLGLFNVGRLLVVPVVSEESPFAGN